MRRVAVPGTPSRADRYVYPTARRRYVAIAVFAGIAAAAIGAFAAFKTSTPLASPGTLASPHAALDANCASCHGPRVSNSRCEHCHDNSATGRLENAGHVWFNAKDPKAASRAQRLECASCHTDHRGRRFAIAASDDRQCRACHSWSLGSHPEFALVKAGAQKDEGLQFSHKKHLKAVRKVRLDDCLYCHEPGGDRRGFVTLNFDQQCSRCHLPKGFIGDTDPVQARLVVLPQDMDASSAKLRPPVTKDRSGTAVVTKLEHKDPWVLFNQVRLASQLDPLAAEERKAGLQRRIDDLTARLAEANRPPVSLASLRGEEARLAREAASKAPGSSERSRADRALERARVDAELGPAPIAAAFRGGRIQTEIELERLRRELALLREIPAAGALGAADKEARVQALTAITAPCALCHVYEAGWMKSVNVPSVAFRRAHFSHGAHLEQTNCRTCHEPVAESKKAENVTLPGIRSCQGCHKGGRSRTDCGECHTFHPQAEPWPPI